MIATSAVRLESVARINPAHQQEILYIGDRVASLSVADGELWMNEECDSYYGCKLDADDVRALIEYLSEQLVRLESSDQES